MNRIMDGIIFIVMVNPGVGKCFVISWFWIEGRKRLEVGGKLESYPAICKRNLGE